MILWTGYGFLVPLIISLGFVFTGGIVDTLIAPHYMDDHLWPKLLSAAASAVAIWFTGLRLERLPGRLLIDPKTNQQVIIGKSHTVLFIPVKWWAPICIVVWAIIAIQEMLGHAE